MSDNAGMSRGIRKGVPPLWEAAITDWLRYLRQGGVRRETLYTYRQRLERTARHIGIADPWTVTVADLGDYFADQDDWDTETRRGHRTSLRSFYSWAVEDGHVAASPALKLPKVKPSAPNPLPVPDVVYDQAHADADPREVLMLRLAAEHGLRRGEIVLVNTTDLIQDLVGWSLVVHGKGGKTRTVPLLDDVAHLLRVLPAGYAFPGNLDGHMSPRWCGELVNRLLPGAWTIHKLRHKAATEWWEASGHDLLLVASLLGHSSTTITQRYVKPREDHARTIVEAASAAVQTRRRQPLRLVSA